MSENINSKNLLVAHSVTARKKLFENVLVNDKKQQRGQNPKEIIKRGPSTGNRGKGGKNKGLWGTSHQDLRNFFERPTETKVESLSLKTPLRKGNYSNQF